MTPSAYQEILSAFLVVEKTAAWKDPFRRRWIAYKPSSPGQRGIVALIDESVTLPDGYELATGQPIPVGDDRQRAAWIDNVLRYCPILDPS